MKSLLTISLAGALYAQDLAPALAQRVDSDRKNTGIVLGLLDENGPRVIARGKSGTDRALDGSTVFEIGSISKTFTGLLLADMIERGEVKPDDPLSKYMPEGAKIPSRNGREITLVSLSQHNSALPVWPDNVDAAALVRGVLPTPKLLDFLARHELRRDPGEKYEYSNIGAGLLGYALARRTGKPYGELVRERILAPLKMTSSSVAPSPDQRPRLAAGHNAGLEPAPHSEFTETVAPAGAILSTADDMLKFAAAQLGLVETPLRAAMARQRETLGRGPAPGLRVGLGWIVIESRGILWHNGMTGGFSAMLALAPAKKKAAIALSNTAHPVDDIGLHAVDSELPVRKFAAPPKQITVDEKVLETYTGEYRFAPAFAIQVTRDGARLFVQATNQPKFEVFGESPTKFFLKAVDAQVSFTKDADGAVDGLILHQNGRDQRAPRTRTP
ncbi:MAG: serine hydrolase [Bryobacteraceae bacterium]